MYVSHVVKASDLYQVTHKYRSKLFRVPMLKKLALVKAGEIHE